MFSAPTRTKATPIDLPPDSPLGRHRVPGIFQQQPAPVSSETHSCLAGARCMLSGWGTVGVVHQRMRAQADRCLSALRRWAPMHQAYQAPGPALDSAASTLDPQKLDSDCGTLDLGAGGLRVGEHGCHVIKTKAQHVLRASHSSSLFTSRHRQPPCRLLPS